MRRLYRAAVQTAFATACAAAACGAAFANADLEKHIANPKNWAMQAGDMYNQRYSKLTQINKQNVGKMQVAWMFSTGVLRGHEGSPLVMTTRCTCIRRSRTRSSRSISTRRRSSGATSRSRTRR